MSYSSFSFVQKNRWVMLVIGAALLVVGVVLGRLSHTTKPDMPSTNPPNQPSQNSTAVAMAVEAVHPSAQTVSQSVSANGSIAGKEVAQVGARVSGVAIDKVLVEVGDYVKAGQVLAVLDNQNATQEVVAAQAELKQAQVALTKAKADLARVEPLIGIDAISREQYDSYKTAVLQAQAQTEMLQARLNTVKTHQGNTQVVAPVSGIISEKSADVGMMTTGAALFSIIKNGVLEWQAGVSAADASAITLGQSVEIKTPTGVAKAVVSRIAPTANASREVVVYATIHEGAGLRNGMYQAGNIILGEQSVLMVPQQAIMTSDGFDYVWLLTATNQKDIYQVARQTVTLGAHKDGLVAVDLPHDKLVVKQSGSFLTDKELVKVVAIDETFHANKSDVNNAAANNAATKE